MADREQEMIRGHIRAGLRIGEELLRDEFVGLIATIAEAICHAYRRGNKVILFGNGGSAADAEHLAAEFVGKYRQDRKPLPAIALTVNGSSLTAIGNDYGFDRVFARQIEAAGVAGDVVFGMSTSGRSRNVIAALQVAKAKHMVTVGFTGQDGDQIGDIVDYCLRIPSDSTPSIQEAHMVIGHAVCAIVEREFIGLVPE